MTATIGSICVGFGGLELAIEALLPVRHAWHVEFDAAASRVLKAHWPEVHNYGDVTRVDWTQVEPVDVFAGGVPCTGYSMAGKRLGSLDDRDLWPVRRVDDEGRPRRGALDAIRQLMPQLVVIENVPGLLTSRAGQDFATILADLDDLGYTVSWTTIGACRVGACHHRHRVFIAATLVDCALPMSDPVAHRAGAGWVPAQSVLFGDMEAVRWPASGFTRAGTVWELLVETCGVDVSLLPTPIARDDGKTPDAHLAMRARMPGGTRTQITSLAVLARAGMEQPLLPTPRASDTGTPGRRCSEGWRPPLSEVLLNLLPTPTARDSSRGSGKKDPAGRPLSEVIALLPTPVAGDAERVSATYSRGNPTLIGALDPERFGQYAAAVHRHELACGLAAPDPTDPGRLGKPRLAPGFPEWMQMLSAGWITDVVGRNDALKLAGNGVNPRQGSYALGTLPTFRATVAHLKSLAAAAA